MSTIDETQTTVQVYQVFIKATPEQIWDAITKPEFTAQYFYGAQHRDHAGAAPRALARRADDWGERPGRSSGTRRSRLVHEWRSLYDPEMAAEEPSRVTWEIEPQDGGISQLTVTHDQLEGAPKTAASVSGAGWMMVLSGLKTLLETGKPLGS